MLGHVAIRISTYPLWYRAVSHLNVQFACRVIPLEQQSVSVPPRGVRTGCDRHVHLDEALHVISH